MKWIILCMLIIGCMAIVGCNTMTNTSDNKTGTYTYESGIQVTGDIYTVNGVKILDRKGLLKNFTDLEFMPFNGKTELFGKSNGQIKLITEGVYIKVDESRLSKIVDKLNDTQFEYYKELIAINGVGEKNAELIMQYYPSKDQLIAACKVGGDLPFHKDIDKLLITIYGDKK
jgi:hypothetical protein